MSKNKFEGGFDSLMGDLSKRDNKEVVHKIEPVESFEKEIKATFLISDALVEKLRAIAYWERILIKDIVHTSFSNFVKEYEKKNGSVKPIPKK